MSRSPFKLGLFLLCGAVVNIAVAWASVVFVDPDFARPTYFDRHGQPRSEFFGWCATVWMRPSVTRVQYVEQRDCGLTPTTAPPPIAASVPWWSSRDIATPELVPENDWNKAQVPIQEARGWPQLSLWCEYQYDRPNYRWKPSGGWNPRATPASPQVGLPSSTAFPIHPIWPGFAINTVFYAAILWLLFAAPGFVRRRIRARRGQCPACAYPVGESDVCTECGHKHFIIKSIQS